MHFRGRGVVALVLATTLVTAPLHAHRGAPQGTVSDDAKAEGKKHFQRAIGLYEEGDKAGALAEFRRAYELTGSAIALYNLGLLLDAKEQYVEADEALTEVLDTKPDPLKPEWRKRATEARDHARTRIGILEIVPTLKDPPPVGSDDPLKGAIVELDGVDTLLRWPLTKPLRASVGTHTVGLMAAGYAPLRVSASVAGEATTKVPLELVAMEGKVAQVTVVANVPRATIFVDGQSVGITPASSSIAVAPGKHIVELKRKGFWPASTVLTVSSGGIGEAKLELREDPTEVARLGARVRIVPSEMEASISIDGVGHAAGSTVAVVPGPHQLHVELAGFVPIDREIEAEEGRTIDTKVALEPTIETLRVYDASVSRHETWGYVGVGAGSAILVTSGIWLVTLLSGKASIDDRIGVFNLRFAQGCSKADATVKTGVSEQQTCFAEKDTLDADQAKNRTNRALALGGLVLGGLVLGAGIYSFASAPDAHRFDGVRNKDTAKVRFSVAATGSYLGFTFAGAF